MPPGGGSTDPGVDSRPGTGGASVPTGSTSVSGVSTAAPPTGSASVSGAGAGALSAPGYSTPSATMATSMTALPSPHTNLV